MGTIVCGDYIFVSESLADRVASVKVDVETAASDHQPLALELTDYLKTGR